MGLAAPDLSAAPAPVSQAFTAAYREHGAFVFRLLRALGVAEMALDDAVQEVFVVVHRRWDTQPEAALVRRWLVAIARKVASHQRRGLSRWLRKRDAMPAVRVVDGPAAQAEARAELAVLQRFLDGLPERQRLAFLLVEIEQMSPVEAARTLEINVNSFHSRLGAARRAFARLRERSADESSRGKI